MEIGTVFWLAVTAGGPIILGIALAYAMSKRRKLSSREKAAQKDGVDRLYDRKT